MENLEWLWAAVENNTKSVGFGFIASYSWRSSIVMTHNSRVSNWDLNSFLTQVMHMHAHALDTLWSIWSSSSLLIIQNYLASLLACIYCNCSCTHIVSEVNHIHIKHTIKMCSVLISLKDCRGLYSATKLQIVANDCSFIISSSM